MLNRSGCIIKHRAMRAAKICLSFLLLLSLGLASSPAHGQVDFGDYEDAVTVRDSEVSLSKAYVFRGETFRVNATASVTLNQDIDFKNVVDIEYEISGKLGTGGEVILGSYKDSAGPFSNLKNGMSLSYTLLDTPLAFPNAAAPGDYTLYVEITNMEPEDIWNTVQENVDVEALTIELGSIKYLGMEAPQIKLALSSPNQVDAGDTFPVNLNVTSPQGVEQVDLSLSYQKSGEAPTLVKSLSTAGTASQTENISAPIYSGELKLIVEATSFVVMGTEIVLDVPTTASSTTIVNLTSPSLSINVDNPATVNQNIDFKLVVKNPSSLPLNIGVYLLPEWEVPAWAGENLAWFFGKLEVVDVAANSEKEVPLSVGPITEEGKSYYLRALATRYQLGGVDVKASPPLTAEAIVTTATTPVGQLTLNPASVYPSENFTVAATVINPGASPITVSYQIKVYTAANSADVFNATPTTWQSGNITISAKETKTIPGLPLYTASTAEVQKYLGFELVVDGTSQAKATGYVKAVAPPVIKVTPSTNVTDMAQPLELGIQLNNPMSVAVNFTLKVLQRVWDGTNWVETEIAAQAVSLSANGKGTVNVSTTTPTAPVIVEYGARVTQVTVAGADFVVAASNWARVQIEELVLPQVSLALNPNPVQAGSSLEIKTSVFNPGDKTMTVPFSIYLKPPSSFPFLWKQEQVTVAAGGSISSSSYLAVEPEWQSFGNMEVTVKIGEIVKDGATIPLSPQIDISQSFSIVSLELRASLKTKVTGFDLSYDAGNKYLVMDKVYLDSTILITNLGGWGSSPELALSLAVITSDGVEIVEGWQVVNADSHDLIGVEFSTAAKIAINDPTAANLSNVRFVARVTAGGATQEFTLGMFRIADGSWRLDDSARLVDKASGQAFASPLWDSDGDGVSDYAEMIEKNTNPLVPGTITDAEKTQRIRELEAMVNSFIFRAEEFIDTVGKGGTLLPSGEKAWKMIKEQGQSAQDSLQMLKTLTQQDYAALTSRVNALLDQIDDLKQTIDDEYGDSSIPTQIRDMAVETMLGMTSEESAADPDGDGLPTAVELSLGYDPHRWDSQQPGTSDKDYLAGSVAEGMTLEDKDLLGSYISVGQMGRLIDDMKDKLPEGWAMTEADELALVQEAQQALKDATLKYIRAFFT